MIPTEPSQDPTGEPVPGVIPDTADELRQLRDAGWGEGDHEDAGMPENFDWIEVE